MLVSRLLLSAYLKKKVAYRLGRRALTSVASSHCGSIDSKEQLMSRAGCRDKGDATKIYILFVYRDANGNLELSPKAQELDEKTKKKLSTCMNKLKTPDFNLGDALVIPDVDVDGITYDAIALACIGPKNAKVNAVEGLNERKENARCSIGAGCKATTLISSSEPSMDGDEDVTQAVNESWWLSTWTPAQSSIPDQLAQTGDPSADGVVYGRAQNWARYLSQMPTDKMTPVGVVKEAKNQLSSLGVKVTAYEKPAIQEKKMDAFLAVARGSSAAPMLLECEYTGDAKAPVVLVVAKGVTFDSGGLCLKKREDMLKHSGMTGAAAALGAIKGLATLKAPANVKLVVPLCENMISGECLKVGEVVHTAKGDDVKIEDTDSEGHLMLADALTYGQKMFKPDYVISVASLTPGIIEATGGGCYGCFTKDDKLWKIAYEAGVETGDRPWRFPIWDFYAQQIINGDYLEIFSWTNQGSGTASHCVGATFLNNFVTNAHWLHYDITGVGKMTPGEAPNYLDPNLMTGRPTRPLIQTIIEMSKNFPPPPPDPDDLCSQQ